MVLVSLGAHAVLIALVVLLPAGWRIGRARGPHGDDDLASAARPGRGGASTPISAKPVQAGDAGCAKAESRSAARAAERRR